ncbi:MAG: hypothetical protein LUD18_07170, partial [Lachnospiraceae bacterium]|nr:hypothetical protein [Lachnospiraceae bacterium]
ILKALYNGEINLDEKVVSKSPAYQQSLKDLDELVTEMEDILDADEIHILNDIMDLCTEQADYLCFEYFRCGYSLACELAAEAKATIQQYNFSENSSTHPEENTESESTDPDEEM